jgi:hypothetical protein
MGFEQPVLSRRQQIKNRFLNTTIGQWMRAVDLVLDEYIPRGGTIEEEAEYVTKLALLMMLTRWYDEEDICLLLDSTALRIPKKLSQTTKFEITKILDDKKCAHDIPDEDELNDSDLLFRDC